MRILYLSPNASEKIYIQAINGEQPSDRLYGVIELQRLGYDVSYKDSRPDGLVGNLIEFINNKCNTNLKGLSIILMMRKYDVIIMKETFSTIITIAARVFRKKIVYLDALFRPPNNNIKKLLYEINMKLCSGIVTYSNTQVKFWSEMYDIPITRFKVIPYCIDVPFYKNTKYSIRNDTPYILSVGRDIARDYRTLVTAMEGLGVRLKIVTLPYLLKNVTLDQSWIELLDRISYETLFQLYCEALFVIIPLKGWGVVYPSGIRGLLEAKALGKAVIVSYSPLLEEYLGKEDGVLYVEPENVKELREKIVGLLEDRDEIMRLGAKGKSLINDKFDMNIFAKRMGHYLSCLTDS